MPEFEKSIEKSHEKDFNKAKNLFSNYESNRAEKLFLKCYKYYNGKNRLRRYKNS